jgi:hypothetical protein
MELRQRVLCRCLLFLDFLLFVLFLQVFQVTQAKSLGLATNSIVCRKSRASEKSPRTQGKS